MAALRTFFGLFPIGFAALAACSAGGGNNNAGITGGAGGSSAAGGSGAVSAGGSSATGSGGSSAHGGTGGGITVAGSSGDGGTGGMAMECAGLTAHSTRLIPTVMILLDNSSSMFELTSAGDTPWKMLYNALMDPATGPVKAFENEIRFGFATYKGHSASGEDDPACATITRADTEFTFGNYDAINSVYTMLGSEINNGAHWETPTGFAINQIVPELAAFMGDPPGPKFILLVTDGNPNTCKTTDPQCGQDRTIKAVQDAFAQQIGTFVVGIGDIVSQPNDGCNVDQARCGSNHLQDIANAGTGLPVTPPPVDYQYQPCYQGEGVMATATYAAAGDAVGMAPYFASNDGAALSSHFLEVLSGVQSCTFDLDAVVTGDPTKLSSVTLDGTALTYGDTAAGWTLEDNHYQVTLQGSACDAFRASPGATLDVSFKCDQMGKPIAEPR